MKMSLMNVLLLIDQYQSIKIKHRGDILYQGRREFFITSDIHASINVVNILHVPDENEESPSITICIDSYFG